MVIAVDIDEVLADTVGAFIEFSNRRFATKLSVNDFIHWNWVDCLRLPQKAVAQRVDEFVTSSYYDNIKPVPGSIEMTKQLSKSHELLAVTSRFGNCVNKTEPWLFRHFPGIFRDVHFAHNPMPGVTSHGIRSKAQICNEIGSSVLIDDSLSFVKECVGSGVRVILLDRPWNKQPVTDGVYRVASWDKIPHIIGELDAIPPCP